MIYLFDLDGTLADSLGVWEKIDADIISLHGKHADRDELRKMASLWYEQLYELLGSMGIKYPSVAAMQDEIDQMAQVYYAEKVQLRPCARQMLQKCTQKGTVLLFTDSPERLYIPLLERYGLSGCFDRMICAREAGLDKKKSSSYTRLADMLGARTSDFVFYDDSPACVSAAGEAGMYTVGVCDDIRGIKKEEFDGKCDRIIYGWEEEWKCI